MWIYEQSSGWTLSVSRRLLAVGYSGYQEGLNNPALQDVKDVGPIPSGLYSIGAPEDTADHGPYVLRLTPHDDTEMFGREGFLIHGDEIGHVGEHLASRGCIILPRYAREQIWQSGDHILEVQT